MNEALNLHPATLNAIKLGLFALVTAALLGMTYTGTREQIELAQLRMEQRALAEVVENLPHQELLLRDRVGIPEQGRALLRSGEQDLIQLVRNDANEVVAMIIPTTAPDGYTDAIRMIVGINLAGELTGVRVIEHKETPGLGDKVDLAKSNWILSFEGKSLENPTASGWAVNKEGGQFDSFTGATITPRAVIRQVRNALLFYRQYAQDVLGMAPAAEKDAQESNP